jgi:hypothetical protein
MLFTPLAAALGPVSRHTISCLKAPFQTAPLLSLSFFSSFRSLYIDNPLVRAIRAPIAVTVPQVTESATQGQLPGPL